MTIISSFGFVLWRVHIHFLQCLPMPTFSLIFIPCCPRPFFFSKLQKPSHLSLLFFLPPRSLIPWVYPPSQPLPWPSSSILISWLRIHSPLGFKVNYCICQAQGSLVYSPISVVSAGGQFRLSSGCRKFTFTSYGGCICSLSQYRYKMLLDQGTCRYNAAWSSTDRGSCIALKLPVVALSSLSKTRRPAASLAFRMQSRILALQMQSRILDPLGIRLNIVCPRSGRVIPIAVGNYSCITWW